MGQSEVTGNDQMVMAEFGPLTIVRLNRPSVINSLNLTMIRLIRDFLLKALALEECRSVLLTGTGDRGFCAGGDIRALWEQVREGRYEEAERFFREEYALDLLIHEYPKPVVVIADGITMGGGIGLAAGADIVIATERTRMAMPETRIGFFPDVGATGWLYAKCPQGYPAFLGLTGYEMKGGETVRVGMATRLIPSGMMEIVTEIMRNYSVLLARGKASALSALALLLDPYRMKEVPPNQVLDSWVAEHFDRRGTLEELLGTLNVCRWGHDYCAEFLLTLSERSPTALKVTHALLMHNRNRPLREVFDSELKAASFIIRQHDYLKGVRARVIDRDDAPRWKPDRLAEVGELPTFDP